MITIDILDKRIDQIIKKHPSLTKFRVVNSDRESPVETSELVNTYEFSWEKGQYQGDVRYPLSEAQLDYLLWTNSRLQSHPIISDPFQTAIYDGNKLVAFLSTFRRDICFSGDPQPVKILIATYQTTHPDYRGMGLAQYLTAVHLKQILHNSQPIGAWLCWFDGNFIKPKNNAGLYRRIEEANFIGKSKLFVKILDINQVKKTQKLSALENLGLILFSRSHKKCSIHTSNFSTNDLEQIHSLLSEQSPYNGIARIWSKAEIAHDFSAHAIEGFTPLTYVWKDTEGRVQGFVHGHKTAIKYVPKENETTRNSSFFFFIKEVRFSTVMTKQNREDFINDVSVYAKAAGCIFIAIFDDLYEGMQLKQLILAGFIPFAEREFLRMGIAFSEHGQKMINFSKENEHNKNFIWDLGYE